MKLFTSLRRAALAAGIMLFANFSFAQVAETEQERVRIMAEEIAKYMTSLETQAAGYPEVFKQLKDGLLTIQQADAEVAKLIQLLNDATTKMEDGGEFGESIAAYRDATIALIAEAEASTNDSIKAAVPDLQKTLEALEQSDETRNATVIEARNLIRSLEQNREAIAFFIKANQVQKASQLIAENVGDFALIIENGKSLAAGLTDVANP